MNVVMGVLKNGENSIAYKAELGFCKEWISLAAPRMKNKCFLRTVLNKWKERFVTHSFKDI